MQESTQIERLWGTMKTLVDAVVEERKVKDLPQGVFVVEGVADEDRVTYIRKLEEDEASQLESTTLQLLEAMIALMYNDSDLRNKEYRSDSTFLAKLSARLNRKVTYTIDAPMAVGMSRGSTKVELLVNPIRLCFTCSSPQEVIAVIRHELYHILYRHLVEGRSFASDAGTQTTLNIAMDCEINQIPLIVNELPEGCITLDYVREKAEDMELEPFAGFTVYYRALSNSDTFKDWLEGRGDDGDNKRTKVVNENNGGTSRHGLGELASDGGHATWGDDVNEDSASANVGLLISETLNGMSDKERGGLSANMQGLLNKITHKPDVNWKDVLKRQHGKIRNLNKRPTLSRPNRRYPNRLDLKGKLPVYDINIVLALDVSGSVGDDALSYALGEVYHLSDELDAPFTVLQIDSELVAVDEVDSPSDFKHITRKAMGGTRFQPAFDYLAEKGLNDKNTLLVYVTDGYGESEGYLNRHGFNNTIWLLVDTNSEETLSCDGRGRVYLLNNDRDFVDG